MKNYTNPVAFRTKSILILIIFIFVSKATTSPMLAYPGFIEDAVEPAQAAQRETTIPASVTIAQAILESQWGDKHIGEANNYFGIKAFQRSDGTVDYGDIAVGWVEAPTREWNGSGYVTVMAKFRKYRNMEDSFRDHGRFFLENPRYAEALKYVEDPDRFAREIHKAGYATSPTYADDLINLMRRYNLYQYDLKRDDAKILSKSNPLTVKQGDEFQIHIRLKNTGFGIWRGSDGYRLVNVNGQPLGADRVQQLSDEVKPNEEADFVISMIAPQKQGTYRTEWRLAHNSPFGPVVAVDVTVESLPQIYESRGLKGLVLGLFRSIAQKVSEWWDGFRRDAERKVQDKTNDLREEAARQLEKKEKEVIETIQKEAEKEAQSFLEELLAQCLGSTAMLGFALALAYHRRNRF